MIFTKIGMGLIWYAGGVKLIIFLIFLNMKTFKRKIFLCKGVGEIYKKSLFGNKSFSIKKNFQIKDCYLLPK